MRNSLRHTNKNAYIVATLLMLALAAPTHAAAQSLGGAHQAVNATPLPAGQASIEGAWRLNAYVLTDGRSPRVDGSILFTESSWGVLFFIVDENGVARRGSGEGGTYAIEGDDLTLYHLYTMRGGDAIEGFDATDFSVTLRESDAAVSEECTVDLTADRLTIHFPSGNRIEFSRSSR